jgi:hypothetical protein
MMIGLALMMFDDGASLWDEKTVGVEDDDCEVAVASGEVRSCLCQKPGKVLEADCWASVSVGPSGTNWADLVALDYFLERPIERRRKDTKILL